MKFKNKLIAATAIPWSIVIAWALLESWILGAGGVDSSDIGHLTSLVVTAQITAVVTACMWILYAMMPCIAGLTCMLIAKNYKNLNKLADFSSAMYFDVVTRGGYRKLYSRGVKTYNVVCRGRNNDTTKSRANAHR